MFNDFYRGKRVLVTGVTGIKGTWLALKLLAAGADVHGVDIRKPAPDSNFTGCGLASAITFTHGDVCDERLMQQLVEDADCIFHLAAVALVYDALRNPVETYRSNTLGVAVVLDAVRKAKTPKRVVVVTTDKVYKPNDGRPWVETDPLGASGPYAVSKACAEWVAQDYFKVYLAKTGHLMATARAGNVILGGDPNSSRAAQGGGRILADCFDALREGQPAEILSPSFTRPYTYGLDVLSGYMSLMTKLDREDVNGEGFNFGPIEEGGVSNGTLATMVCEMWGGPMWRSGVPREEPFQFQALCCDKSRDRLGWKPAFTLDQSLSATVRWEKFWAAGVSDPASLLEFNRVLLREHREHARELGIEWATQ